MPVCSTGNCTFPTFSSISVCSDCTNVSSHITRDFDPLDNEWQLPSGASTDMSTLAMAFPSNPTMMYRPVVNQTIADFFYLSEYMLPNGSFSKPQAFECVMWMCVKTFSASMSGGVFHEQIISRWPEANESIPGFPTLPSSSSGPSRNFSLHPPNDTAEYTIDMATIATMKIWLLGVLSGLSWSPGQNAVPTGSDVSMDLGQAFYRAQQISKTALKSWNNATSELAGPANILAKVADGMTVTIRNMAGPDSSVPGTANGVETFVQARWLWAILPIALVVLTLAFMGLTLFMSVHNGIPVWKSSSLAVLVHGLGDDTSLPSTTTKLSAIETGLKEQSMMISPTVQHKIVGRSFI